MIDRNQVKAKMSIALSDIIDHDVTLNDETVADDVEGWDSIAHVRLIIALEQLYKIRFSAEEIASCKSVGNLVDFIEEKAR